VGAETQRASVVKQMERALVAARAQVEMVEAPVAAPVPNPERAAAERALDEAPVLNRPGPERAAARVTRTEPAERGMFQPRGLSR
jgi:hypothetical protein